MQLSDQLTPNRSPAAAAEEAELALLHHDRDVETIAHTTGRPVRTFDHRR
ncbi:hypothetical protein EDD90_9113 [Streptomyces sp. Ag109_O5-1]|nr:hypothetical protein EDD90_9113 [Streptomyces sp. Ag109_O5-1]